ncbi:LLM class flavin-dependent oxidoreductase [Plantactinospora sp. S1510]|uniref:LLM class flavin-dependent oxidoreductase n=1 Tax=Plantactinospora alkalitolerans TaxID=2789879 RepID=A0ABS0GY64_9ACTN|nr:LLM class flavin-dependent oxidoreductase [Plantactinospora alkalitolerans]MBF9131140.1 LLM class flavin-dependent oxidoreductase [Plantactinospora alkalitolerans]
MPDYGHELLFGTFLTPTANDPERVVALAELTESAGLDLATFQDHPYNPDLLDTWTLLSWVAARTERLRVSANVLNLPLRPPAVLARAAASLDLLSGGRFELGLGAGAFWDAIEGMGGGRLSPADSVAALSEAIDILRGAWDTSTRGPLRLRGEHHPVPGMRRGPTPAHDIDIWLGAYKPRMLALTGSKADGWLPTLEYLKSPDRVTANRLLDEAATAAGRDPRQIRRLLNLFQIDFSATDGGFLRGTPEQWVDQLLPLVLDEGFSAFIVGRDDPRIISTFGHEVAPALREAVARERTKATAPTGPTRSTVTLTRRQPGTDHAALPTSLAAGAVQPGDPEYERVRHTYSRQGSPAIVLRPRDAAEVVDAVTYTRARDVPLSVRSGGHGISGRSTNDGGIVLDLSRMNRVEVLDRATRRIRLEPGARWGEVAQALAPAGLAMSSGDYGDVGVGGLATTGGIGYLARRFGLTIDHVVAAEIVLADGTLVRADAEHHPDLFWAIRGAGGNFGVVTALELEAYEVGNVVHAQLAVDATRAAELLHRWGRLAEDAPRELTSFLSLFPARRQNPPVARVTLVYAGDDIEAAERALTPFLEIGPILDQQAQLVPYPAIVAPSRNRHHGQGLDDVHSGLLRHITPEVAASVETMIRSGDVLIVQLRSVGGAVNDVHRDATAYPHRRQNFSLLAATVPDRRARLDKLWSDLYEHLDGMYLSFESDTDPQRLLDAFPEPTLGRLRRLKARYDPDNVFNRNFPIPPATGGTGSS